MHPFFRFMLITQKLSTPIDKYLDHIKQCADGGITSLQLREKNLSFEQLIDLGERLMMILESYNIPLIINDFPQLAKSLQSEYIHIGQKDGSLTQTLQEFPNTQIGLSIESLENIDFANQYKLSYVTASAVFPSDNKSNLKTIWGLNGLKKLSQISNNPLTAIGGINLNNLEDVIMHGAQGIALIGALHNTSDPYKTTKLFRDRLDSYF